MKKRTRADAGRPRKSPSTNQWDSMPTPTLFRQVATLWRIRSTPCDDCGGSTYRHLCQEVGWIGYSRCPSCQTNILDKDATALFDLSADHALDAAFRRAPILGSPFRT